MKILISFFLAFSVCTGLFAQDFKKHIVFLSSELLHGRAPATGDEREAAEYIKREFLSMKNISVQFQKFPFENDSAINVIGVLDLKKDSIVIISAHYDHLGYGTNKSREVLKKGVHPGADDNASGVAMMIELAKVISETTGWKYNFLFAGFSAHEAGLIGSEYFHNSTLCSSLRIRAVINFDMVGRLDRNLPIVRISGVETDEEFGSFYKSNAEQSLNFRFDDSNIYESDLKPFAENNIPTLNMTTGTHDDYHKMTDTENKINYNGMNKIFKLTEALLNIFRIK